MRESGQNSVAANRLLAIIPARGGSKGVLRKNMRLVNGKPLIEHTIRAVIDSGVADRVLVSSDDDGIIAWAKIHGHEVHVRDAHLAADDATISDVAAAIADEYDWDGVVAVFQPTSPLRGPDAIRGAVARFSATDCDSLASCVRERHLFWLEGDEGEFVPLFAERVNRQYLHSRLLRETGAIQLVNAGVLRATRRVVSSRHDLFELSEDESLDIDTYEDLALARRRLEQATVVFRVRANHRTGSGHLFHCLQLAEELDEHRPVFLLVDCDPFVGEMLSSRGFTAIEERDMVRDLERLSRSDGVRVVINDVLDTVEREVLQQRAAGFLVINVEDLGSGARFAHWVVNALYPLQHGAEHVAWGPRYAALRDEFRDPPPKVISADANRILLAFGGTDPNRFGPRCAALLRSHCPDAEIRVISGPGAEPVPYPEGVQVLKAANVAHEMFAADIVLTSAGRTVYEAAVTGTPVVVMAQNAREATHAHLGYDAGVVFLGLGALVDDARLVSTVSRLLEDQPLRSELSSRLRRSVDGLGAVRIANHIRSLMREHA